MWELLLMLNLDTRWLRSRPALYPLRGWRRVLHSALSMLGVLLCVVPAPGTSVAEANQEQEPSTWPARFERMSIAEGLSFPVVRDIVQDEQGFIWIATDSGLNRYDGYEFTVYREDPGDPRSIRFDEVWVIFEDRDGTLWVGGAGGLDRFERKTGTFAHVDTRGQVFAINEDREGTLWVGFWHGLYGYDRATGEVVFSSQPNPAAAEDWGQRTESTVLAIEQDGEGDLWIGTATGLYRRDERTWIYTHYPHDGEDPTSPSSNAITAIYEDGQGELWIGTDGGGLNRFDRAADGFVHYQHEEGNPDSLGDDRVLSMVEDGAGRLWLGTTKGLDGLDRGQGGFVHYAHDAQNPNSLSDDTVLSLLVDGSGVLWAGTADGMNRWNGREGQFAHYGKQDDAPAGRVYTQDVADLLKGRQPAILSDDRILAIHEDEGGVLWIGTYDGGLNRLDRERGQLGVYQHDPGDATSLSSNTVSAIFEDGRGELWVGTGEGWLEQFDPQTGGVAYRQRISEVRLSAMAEDPEGRLWIGTAGEGMFRLDGAGGTLVHYPQFWRDPDHWRRNGSLSSHIVTSVVIDGAGAPWVGTAYGGINVWSEEEQRFNHYRHDPDDPNSLSHDQVLSLLEDPTKGVMWIGTGGGGLNGLDRETEAFRRYGEAEGLAGEAIGCMLADDAGCLWLGTVRGLSRFNPQTGSFRNYDERDGVGALSVGQLAPGSCLKGDSGEMFFGGADGLYVFRPEEIKENANPPPVAITSLRISNEVARRDLAADEEIELPYGDNFVSFEFAALDYTEPEKNQYAYRMEGLDRDWVYAGTRRYADYPDLKPGKYVFRVKGSNSDGVWNEEGVAVHITIEPPFSQTWTFRIALALAVILGAAGVYRQRVRNVEARSRDLERQVRERTREMERRRQVAEGLRDILAVLNSDRPLDEVLDYIVTRAGRLLGADVTLLYAVEPGGGAATIQASSGLPEELAGMEAVPFEASGVDEAILSGQPYVVPELPPPSVPPPLSPPRRGGGGEVGERWPAITRQHFRSFAAVPLPGASPPGMAGAPRTAGEVKHCLAFWYKKPRVFSDEELGLATTLADQAALAIENARLYEQAQELAAVEERQRLARDLHDAVSQTLFSASLIAEALPELWQADPDEGLDMLEKLQQLSRGALAEMRALLMELRPATLVEASMKDLLRQLGQAVSGREGIPVSVTVDEGCDLPTEVHVALYRIAQEALNNVVKHAQASRVEVGLRCTASGAFPPAQSAPKEGRLGGRVQGAKTANAVLHIRDDGLGFDPHSVSQERLGLGIMQERAAQIGARLDIESAPGGGTQVTVAWHDEEGMAKEE